MINVETGMDEFNNDRQVMHVQSVSHWAAANIGPYSQVVVSDGILHIAGLIGLVPGSMELVSGNSYVLGTLYFIKPPKNSVHHSHNITMNHQ